MYKKMREYTHEEFVDIIKKLNEEELLELSANYGGYPVLFRMALDERINHIPFIQTGSSIIVRMKKMKYYFNNVQIIIDGDYLEDVKI